MNNLITQVVNGIKDNNEYMLARHTLVNELKDTPIYEFIRTLQSEFSIFYTIMYPSGIMFHL